MIFDFRGSKFLHGVVVVVLCFVIEFTGAQFPKVCTSQDALESGTCCPIPDGLSEQCGGVGRGICASLVGSPEGDYQPHYTWLEMDDRAFWPHKFFQYACQCEYPFYGPDCSQCVFGYSGSECSVRSVVMRWNITDSSHAVKLEMFLQGLEWMKHNISDFRVMYSSYESMVDANGTITPHFTDVNWYDYFTWFHYYACRRVFTGGFKFMYQDWAHFGPSFGTFHRFLMLIFERQLQATLGDPTFALPYWDWSGGESCDVCTDEYFGSSDLTNGGYLTAGTQFSEWETICFDYNKDTDYRQCDPRISYGKLTRSPGEMVHRLPYKYEVGYTLNLPQYDTLPYNPLSNCSWRNTMGGNSDVYTGLSIYGEDLRYNHGMVHIYLGGTMYDVPSSVNDPIFYPHHVYVDRILEMWIRQHKATPEKYLPDSGAPMGHNRRNYIVPSFPVVAHQEVFTRSDDLGYTYDDVDFDGYSSDYESLQNLRFGDCGPTSTYWQDVPA